MGYQHLRMFQPPGRKPDVPKPKPKEEPSVPCPVCADSPAPGMGDVQKNMMGPGSNGKHKKGKWKGKPRKSMPVCKFCRGTGVVYLNRICECGMPAVLLDKKRKVWSCGDLACIEHRHWRLHGRMGSSYSAQSALAAAQWEAL